jgi:dephospho-CoA kinase
MILIGLTGGPGTGKSLAAEYIKRQGAVIISGDDTGREVLDFYPAVLKKLVRAFGNDILESDGTLNRRDLGRIVFGVF